MVTSQTPICFSKCDDFGTFFQKKTFEPFEFDIDFYFIFLVAMVQNFTKKKSGVECSRSWCMVKEVFNHSK